MTSTTSTATRSPHDRIAAQIEHRLRALARYTDDAHAPHLRASTYAPVRRTDWLAMDSAARQALLRERITDQVQRAADQLGARATATPRPIAPRTVEAPTRPADPAPAAPPTTSAPVVQRWTVSCACGCGLMHPAPGPRPVIRWCPASAADRAKRAALRAEARHRRAEARTA